jgi:hypothetical protein
LSGALARSDRLDIGVTGEQQMRRDAFQERCAVLARVRPRDQIEQRMRGQLAGAVIEHEGQRADALGGQPHRAMHDGVLGVARARQRRIVARRPPGTAAALDGDEACGLRRLLLRRAEHVSKKIEHEKSPPKRALYWMLSVTTKAVASARYRCAERELRGSTMT